MSNLLFFLFSFSATAEISTHCDYDRECLIEVPGSQCADGTPSFVTLVRRRQAKNVLIYLKGGGVCWNAKSCTNGLARPLTRVELPTEWNTGLGIHQHENHSNPFGRDYDIVTVPYCTGDAFTGDNVMHYTDAGPATIRHYGYQNVLLSLGVAKSLVPNPERAVLLGCSAGGIGAFFHLNNFRKVFPASQRYVISDAGLPFKPPHILPESYQMVMRNWGADKHLDQNDRHGRATQNFGDLIRRNTDAYPDTRFGFISSYRDGVMTFFGIAVGSAVGMKIVRDNIIDIAENAIGRNAEHARVFFTDTNTHCHTPKDLESQVALSTPLSLWLHQMLEKHGWSNIRPDLVRSIKPADQLTSDLPSYP